jgi:hypothetical protein
MGKRKKTAIVVVNCRTDAHDVYIGRHGGRVTAVPKRGCFGNPFPEAKYGREKCISLFREYFLARVERDKAFRKAVLKLRGKRLGCWCKPQACHGDIIKEWLDGQREE